MLLSIIVLEFFLPSTTAIYSTDKAKLDSLLSVLEKESNNEKNKDKPGLSTAIGSPALQAFNPNHITAEQWQTLGLPKYVAERIIKYREKGGKFKIKKDLLKIYGFPEPLYDQLYSYIQLPETFIHDKKDEKHEKTFAKANYEATKFSATYEKKEPIISRFNLNMADTSQLKLVKGIGPALSKRIIKYRNSLGGFASIEQVYEIYGLDSMVVGELLKYGYLPENGSYKKININSATFEELDAHPYISPKVAKVIIAYRQQHGRFSSLENVYEIRVLDKSILTKLAPYLNFE